MSPSDQPASDLGAMSFGDHLQELRTRLFRALIVPLPLAIGFFFIASDLRALLMAPLFAALKANRQSIQVQALNPAETITTDLKLSLVAALAVSAPWVLYQLWKFISPGLYAHERRYIHFLTPLSGVMTACGMALFYWVLLPLTLLVLVSFGAERPTMLPIPAAEVAPDGTAPASVEPDAGSTGASAPAAPRPFAFPVLSENPVEPKPGQAWISPSAQALRIAVPLEDSSPNAVIALAGEAEALVSGESASVQGRLAILEVPLTVLGGVAQVYRLSEYISFALLLLLGSIVAFQMPLVVLLLGWAGLVSPKFLREKRKWAVFIMAIVAAIVTPPDVTSMLLLLVPLWLLYEFSIVLLVLVPAHRVARGRILAVSRSSREPDESEGSGDRWGGGPPP
jgi:sec-independent protein translocase protein TatC